MTTAKNKVFIGLLLENCYLVGRGTFGGGNKNLVRRKSTEGRNFSGGG